MSRESPISHMMLPRMESMQFPGNIAPDSIPCEAQRPSKVSNPSVTILYSLSTVKIFALPSSILPSHQLMDRVPQFGSTQITADF